MNHGRINNYCFRQSLVLYPTLLGLTTGICASYFSIKYIMGLIGASTTWRWYGYNTSWVNIDGIKVQSVSGGGRSVAEAPQSAFYATGLGGNYIVVDQENDFVNVTRWLEPAKFVEFLLMVYQCRFFVFGCYRRL